MVKTIQITPKTTVTIIRFLAVLVFSSAYAISPLSAAELACYRKQKISNTIKDLNTFQMNRSVTLYIAKLDYSCKMISRITHRTFPNNSVMNDLFKTSSLKTPQGQSEAIIRRRCTILYKCM
jgi:hypothetical protein